MANFPIKAKNSCIFGFSWFLVVFGGFWPQKPPLWPPLSKKYLFLCHKKIWVMFGHSGVTLEKVQIWPYMATLGHSGPLYSPNGPKFGQTHKTPNFYHIVGTNPWVTKKFVIWWFFIDTLLKITRLKVSLPNYNDYLTHCQNLFRVRVLWRVLKWGSSLTS